MGSNVTQFNAAGFFKPCPTGLVQTIQQQANCVVAANNNATNFSTQKNSTLASMLINDCKDAYMQCVPSSVAAPAVSATPSKSAAMSGKTVRSSKPVAKTNKSVRNTGFKTTGAAIVGNAKKYLSLGYLAG